MHEPSSIIIKDVNFEKEKNSSNIFNKGDLFKLRITFEAEKDLKKVNLGVVVKKNFDSEIVAFHLLDKNDFIDHLWLKGEHKIALDFQLPLLPGEYSLDVFTKPYPGFWNSQTRSFDWIKDVCIFRISVPDGLNASAYENKTIIYGDNCRWYLN